MARDDPERALRDPVPGPGDDRWFEAAAAGTLLLKQCATCRARHHYPRALCPFCLSEDVRWVPACGMGEIHTFSITRPRGAIPYCIAYVTLDEGVTVLTNIVDCELDAVRIGQRVRVVFRQTKGGFSVPMFTPV